MTKRVLFLCTGNYYRSRFAEILFNHLAAERGVPWRADSAGLRVKGEGSTNVGPISCFAEAGLELRNVAVPQPYRFPRQVLAAEFASADRVVALKEAEHRPLMQNLHPEHVDRISYWHIHDLDASMPHEALLELEAHIRRLLEELAKPA